jgi:cysteine-S-conjugate beta-lyase
LTRRIGPRTRAIHLCHPHNPTGYVFGAAELAVVGRVARDAGLLIVSNEIHGRLVHDGAHHPAASVAPEIAAITVTLEGPSKSHNLAGLGGTFLWSTNLDLMADLKRRTGFRMAPAKAVQQAAIAAAYAGDSPWLVHTRQRLRAGRDHVAAFLTDRLPDVRFVVPSATYFYWLDAGAYVGDANAAAVLAERCGVIGEPGAHFGASDRFVRLTFATEERILDAALQRLTRLPVHTAHKTSANREKS